MLYLLAFLLMFWILYGLTFVATVLLYIWMKLGEAANWLHRITTGHLKE